MTKRNYLLIILFILATWIGYYSRPTSTELHTLRPQKGTIVMPEDRKMISPDRMPIPSTSPVPKTYANVPSTDWEERLEVSFREQAPSLKDIQITREDSLIWMRDGNAILVESVKIVLKNQSDEESSFRALVDSQTGKVLESWDRSITDPLNPKTGFKLKYDPRHNQ